MNLRLRLPVLSKCAMSINRFRSYSRHRRHCSTKPNRGSIDVLKAHVLADIAAGKVDTVVVYKVDRLTRSLADFAKIVDHQ